MTAIAANQIRHAEEGGRESYLCAGSTIIWERSLVFIDSSGYAADDTAVGVNKFAGVAEAKVDNSAGSNGDLPVEVHRVGAFPFIGTGFAQTSVGKKAYAIDNNTVTLDPTTAGAVYIGVISKYYSSTKVKVLLDPHASETQNADTLELNVLTFNGATGVNEIHLTTNLADALSIEDTAGDLVKFDTTTGTQILTITPALAIATADKLTVGGVIVPQDEIVSVSIPLHASKVVYNLLVARTALQVLAIDYTPDIAQGGALTATVVKATGTATPASATTPMHIAAAINLNGTAHTVQSITLTVTGADLQLAAGERIGLVLSGAMTVGSGLVTIRMKRI